MLLCCCHQHPSLELFITLDFKIHLFIHLVISIQSVAELVPWTRRCAGQSLAHFAFSNSPPVLTSPAGEPYSSWSGPKTSSLEKVQSWGWGVDRVRDQAMHHQGSSFTLCRGEQKHKACICIPFLPHLLWGLRCFLVPLSPQGFICKMEILFTLFCWEHEK